MYNPFQHNGILLSLQERNFKLYWFGQIISVVGIAMQTIAQAWLVLQLTHSAWQLGLVGALESLPMLLFSLFGGVIADRWPRKKVLFVTQTIEMLQAGIFWLLLVLGKIQLWEIYILVILLGIASSIDRPVRQALVSELVAPKLLPNALALNTSVMITIKIIGPALGGVFIALWGVNVLFLINAISFFAIIIALALMHDNEFYQNQEEREKQHFMKDLLEGFIYMGKHTLLFSLLLIITAVLLLGSNFNVTLPLFAIKVFHAGSQGLGFLSGAFAVGALCGTLYLARKNNIPDIKSIYITMILFSFIEILLASTSFYLFAVMLIFLLGFFENLYATRTAIAVQTNAPSYIRGRLISMNILLFDGSLPLGFILMGGLANGFGVKNALFICGCLCLCISIVTVAIYKAKHMLIDNLAME